ncbi:MAG: hypothetical protein Q4C70_01100 [Planctomycetia bacterium]|nr:hypothetical protein [Planctomycetia bacterium]
MKVVRPFASSLRIHHASPLSPEFGDATCPSTAFFAEYPLLYVEAQTSDFVARFGFATFSVYAVCDPRGNIPSENVPRIKESASSV